MGVVRHRGCIYAPMFIHPHTFGTPICSESFNRVFILLYHNCFPTLEAVMGGCQT